MDEEREDAVRWAERILKRPDGYDSEYVNTARYILSPPAAEPGFDAAEFVWKCLGEHPANAPKLVAELRAALGTGVGDEGVPVTGEWLRSVGFVHGRFDGELVLPPIVHGLNVRDGIVNEYWVVRTYLIPDENKPRTRGHVRRLCTALGITLPTAPAQTERNGE